MSGSKKKSWKLIIVMVTALALAITSSVMFIVDLSDDIERTIVLALLCILAVEIVFPRGKL